MKRLKKIGIFIIVIILIVVALKVFSASKSKKKTDDYREFVWPKSSVANHLPIPESLIGKIAVDREDTLSVYVSKTTIEQFDKYVEACKELGFTIDYSSHDGFYSADDEEGYHLYLAHQKEDVMYISIDAPKEESSPVIDDSIEEASDSGEESTIEHEDESNSSEQTEDSSTDIEEEEYIDGMRADVKNAIDAYAAFMDEYCEFLKTYSETDNTAAMLAEYNEYMEKYLKMSAEFEAIEERELNEVENAYFTKILTETNQKLLEITAQQPS